MITLELETHEVDLVTIALQEMSYFFKHGLPKQEDIDSGIHFSPDIRCRILQNQYCNEVLDKLTSAVIM